MRLLPRLLESQLQSQKWSHENEAEALRGEIQSLKEENNRQQQLLAQNLQLPPEARIEASLQHEITRLTNENLVSTGAGPKRSPAGSAQLCRMLLVSCWENSLPHTCYPLTRQRRSEESSTLLAEVNQAYVQVVFLTEGSLRPHLEGLKGITQLYARLLIPLFL